MAPFESPPPYSPLGLARRALSANHSPTHIRLCSMRLSMPTISGYNFFPYTFRGLYSRRCFHNHGVALTTLNPCASAR